MLWMIFSENDGMVPLESCRVHQLSLYIDETSKDFDHDKWHAWQLTPSHLLAVARPNTTVLVDDHATIRCQGVKRRSGNHNYPCTW